MNRTKKAASYLYKNSLVRFLIVGGLGTLINLVVFFIFADIFGKEKNIASIIAFVVAVTQNYVLNHTWSFKKHISTPMSLKTYIKYFSVIKLSSETEALIQEALMIKKHRPKYNIPVN